MLLSSRKAILKPRIIPPKNGFWETDSVLKTWVALAEAIVSAIDFT